MICDKKELASFFDVTVRTIDNWIHEGLPKTPDNKYFDTAKVIEWKHAYENLKHESNDIEREKLRKIKLEADRIQIEINEKMGSLVKSEDVERVWNSFIISSRSKILSLPAKLASIYESVDNRHDMFAYAKRECLIILNELSEDESYINDIDNQESTEIVSTTTEFDS